MKKIPSIWKRSSDDPRLLIPGDWTPGVDEATLRHSMATLKFDGTSTYLDANGEWWARHALKKDKEPPPGWVWAGSNEGGKRQGWIPMYLSQYFEIFSTVDPSRIKPDLVRDATYELVGPKIGKNPYDLKKHWLWMHGATKLGYNFSSSLACAWIESNPCEGIVWWSKGTPYAKLKATDIGLTWPRTIEDNPELHPTQEDPCPES